MSGAGKVFIAIGIVLIIFAVLFFMGLLGLDPDEAALGGMILFPIGAVFAAAGIYLVTRARKKAYLLAEGVDGKARIIEWWLFARSGGGGFLCGEL